MTDVSDKIVVHVDSGSVKLTHMGIGQWQMQPAGATDLAHRLLDAANEADMQQRAVKDFETHKISLNECRRRLGVPPFSFPEADVVNPGTRPGIPPASK